MKFITFLNESMLSGGGYTFSRSKVGNTIVFNIETGDMRDYRMIFVDIGKGNYVCKFGYSNNTRDNVEEIKRGFYDVHKVINTIIDIFTGLYMSQYEVNNIVYDFGHYSNKSYRLLVESLFRKELKNYYIKVADNHENFDTKTYIQVKNNKSNAEPLTAEEINKI